MGILEAVKYRSASWLLGAPLTATAVVALYGCATFATDQTEVAAASQPPETDSRPTAEFRIHHAEIREHLGHLDGMALSLLEETPQEQRATMNVIVTFLTEHIVAHAADEERVLYPVVERYAGVRTRLTEVPIFEHRIIEREIAALRTHSGSESPDARAFMRDALHLVGMIGAHFDVEEEVLLPVLDRSMTREEFQREVAEKMSDR